MKMQQAVYLRELPTILDMEDKSTTKVAKRLGMSRNTLDNLAHHRRGASLAAALIIAKRLGTSVEALVGQDEINRVIAEADMHTPTSVAV